jgi:hypothetical protein
MLIKVAVELFRQHQKGNVKKNVDRHGHSTHIEAKSAFTFDPSYNVATYCYKTFQQFLDYVCLRHEALVHFDPNQCESLSFSSAHSSSR